MIQKYTLSTHADLFAAGLRLHFPREEYFILFLILKSVFRHKFSAALLSSGTTFLGSVKDKNIDVEVNIQNSGFFRSVYEFF